MKLQTKASKMLRGYQGSRLQAERELYQWLRSDPGRWRRWCEQAAKTRVHELITGMIYRTHGTGGKSAHPETAQHYIHRMKEILTHDAQPQ